MKSLPLDIQGRPDFAIVEDMCGVRNLVDPEADKHEEIVFIWMITERAWLNSKTMMPEPNIEYAYGFKQRDAIRICQQTTQGWLPNSSLAPRFLPVREADIIHIQDTFSECAISEHKQFYGDF